MDINQKLLSPKELSLVLGISINTIYGYTSKKLIPYFRIGRVVRFDLNKINLWLKQRSIPCVSDFSS